MRRFKDATWPVGRERRRRSLPTGHVPTETMPRKLVPVLHAIIPRIARRGIDSSERLGRYRCVVERTLSWRLGFRRLDIRYER